MNEEESNQDVNDFKLLKSQLDLIARIRSSSPSVSNASVDSKHSVANQSLISLDPAPPISPLNEDEVWPLHLDPYFLEHYIFGDIIGFGSYAQVRECIDSKTLQRLAVKIVNIRVLTKLRSSMMDNLKQEIKILRRLDHPNVIQLVQCLHRGSKIYIFMEFCSFTLKEVLEAQDKNRLEPLIARNIFSQLIEGLVYIHSKGIVHRDIKPDNLLLNRLCQLKIIDFGVSQVLSVYKKENTCFNHEGSPLFQAPEIVAGVDKYDGYEVDVWSSGVTLFYMVYGTYPFEDTALLGLYDKILADDLVMPRDSDIHFPTESLNNLLYSMLDKIVSRRISMHEIQKHPWMLLSQDSELDSSDLIGFAEQISLMPNENKTGLKYARKDIYRSISVLPYLYAHHFPEQKVVKYKPYESLAPSTVSKPSTVSSLDSTVSSISSTVSSVSSTASESLSIDYPSSQESFVTSPHEIVDDTSIEWGTKEEYDLLKLPHVRSNRVREEEVKPKRKKKYKINNKKKDEGQENKVKELP